MLLQGLVKHGYQGNDNWAGFGILALGLATYTWLRYRGSRRGPYPMKRRDALVASGVFLALAAFALEQILTH